MGVKQQEDATDSDHSTYDDCISSLTKIDPLYDIIYNRESTCQIVDSCLHPFKRGSLIHHMLFGLDSYANLIVNHSIRTNRGQKKYIMQFYFKLLHFHLPSKMFILFEVQLRAPVPPIVVFVSTAKYKK